ncbi:MAG: porin family protein [Gemmatimonadota bacterium]
MRLMRSFGAPILVLVSAARLSAQTGGLELTAFAGPNYSWLSGTTEGSAEGRVGVSIGLRLHQPIVGDLSVDPDIGFAYKGANARVGAAAATNVQTARLWYLQFPIPIRYTLASHGKIKPRLSAGPFIAVRVGCTAELGSSTEQSQVSCSDLRPLADTTAAFDPYKTWDAGFVASFGFNIPIWRTKFDFELRYEHGLINIARISGRIRNRTLMFAVGVPF